MADFHQRETNGILRLILGVLIVQLLGTVAIVAVLVKERLDTEKEVQIMNAAIEAMKSIDGQFNRRK